jgi:hypothetical protein
MEMVKPKVAAEIIGASYSGMMNYLRRWPWLRWKSGPGERVPTWMPRPAIYLAEVIHQGYDAGLSHEEIDSLLYSVDYYRALYNEKVSGRRGLGYPNRLVRDATADSPQVVFPFDAIRAQIDEKLSAVPLGDDRQALVNRDGYNLVEHALGAMRSDWEKWRRQVEWRDRI